MDAIITLDQSKRVNTKYFKLRRMNLSKIKFSYYHINL
jgi:hypothetical protein